MCKWMMVVAVLAVGCSGGDGERIAQLEARLARMESSVAATPTAPYPQQVEVRAVQLRRMEFGPTWRLEGEVRIATGPHALVTLEVRTPFGATSESYVDHVSAGEWRFFLAAFDAKPTGLITVWATSVHAPEFAAAVEVVE